MFETRPLLHMYVPWDRSRFDQVRASGYDWNLFGYAPRAGNPGTVPVYHYRNNDPPNLYYSLTPPSRGGIYILHAGGTAMERQVFYQCEGIAFHVFPRAHNPYTVGVWAFWNEETQSHCLERDWPDGYYKDGVNWRGLLYTFERTCGHIYHHGWDNLGRRYEDCEELVHYYWERANYEKALNHQDFYGRYDPPLEPCPACIGSRQTTYPNVENYHHFLPPATCPACRGSGTRLRR